MGFLPRNAAKIIGDKKLLREYAFKPHGYDIPKNCHHPKKHPEYKFINHRLLLIRPGKPVSDNTMTFRMDETISKPEIKQYVEKLYNVKVDKVNTARFMGKVKASMITGKPYMTKNFKKVFVMCDGKIPSILNETMK